MDQDAFEMAVERAFERLPDRFRNAIENVGVFIEEYPSDELVASLKLRSKHDLFGLYQGIPLTARGTWYGMTPVPPDKITLYRRNIESASRSDRDIEQRILEVLMHEIGHYFGMTEKEIREAGY
jgi:predicted Zn-dependent protease with MMP-like domain